MTGVLLRQSRGVLAFPSCLFLSEGELEPVMT